MERRRLDAQLVLAGLGAGAQAAQLRLQRVEPVGLLDPQVRRRCGCGWGRRRRAPPPPGPAPRRAGRSCRRRCRARSFTGARHRRPSPVAASRPGSPSPRGRASECRSPAAGCRHFGDAVDANTPAGDGGGTEGIARRRGVGLDRVVAAPVVRCRFCHRAACARSSPAGSAGAEVAHHLECQVEVGTETTSPPPECQRERRRRRRGRLRRSAETNWLERAARRSSSRRLREPPPATRTGAGGQPVPTLGSVQRTPRPAKGVRAGRRSGARACARCRRSTTGPEARQPRRRPGSGRWCPSSRVSRGALRRAKRPSTRPRPATWVAPVLPSTCTAQPR